MCEHEIVCMCVCVCVRTRARMCMCVRVKISIHNIFISMLVDFLNKTTQKLFKLLFLNFMHEVKQTLLS